MKLFRFYISLFLCFLLAACTTIRKDYPEPPPAKASLPGADGPIADFKAEAAQTHSSEKSGFLLLENNTEALNWRLALIDEARYPLDIQYYLRYSDDSGRLIIKRVLDADKRGVRVRLIADGILLIGKGQILAALEAHPNVEVRIFNPLEQNHLGRKKRDNRPWSGLIFGCTIKSWWPTTA